MLAVAHVAVEWGLIVATIYLCQRFWNPFLYIFAVAFIGARQHALLVLMHDGVHHRLLRNRRLNDWMSEAILAWPHLVSARQYRKNHFAHHRYLNTPEDPDLKRRKGDPAWVFPQAAPAMAKMLLRDMTGLNAPGMLKLAAAVAKADSVPMGFLALRYGFYAASLGIIIYAGAFEAFALYWIVPMFTWLVMVMRIRGIAEHHAIDEPPTAYPRTRTTQPTWLERIFLAPKNVNYHIEHHFFPSVPFYRLPKLHAILMSKPGYREGAHLTPTYWGVLEESVGRTPSRRGKFNADDGAKLDRIRRVVEATG
jgi:fatty acid desaturase